MGINY